MPAASTRMTGGRKLERPVARGWIQALPRNWLERTWRSKPALARARVGRTEGALAEPAPAAEGLKAREGGRWPGPAMGPRRSSRQRQRLGAVWAEGDRPLNG